MPKTYICNECNQQYCSLHIDPTTHECNLVKETQNTSQVNSFSTIYGNEQVATYQEETTDSELLRKIEQLKKIPYNFVIISLKSLPKLKQKYGWKGEGIFSDPLVIDNIDGLQPFMSFKTNDLFIHIKNITVFHISFKRCKNITIENCKIGSLRLERCSFISVRKNKISEIPIIYSRACNIEGNQISKENIDKDHSIYEENLDKVIEILCFAYFAIFPLLIISFIEVNIEQILLFLFLGALNSIVIWILYSRNKSNKEVIEGLEPNYHFNNIVLPNDLLLQYEIMLYYQNCPYRDYFTLIVYIIMISIPVILYLFIFIL